MQLTRFDRWLREAFVYETYIRTLRPVESIPKGIRAIEMPESPMQRYRYLYIARKSSDADLLIIQLRKNSQMFTTEIVERKTWYKPLIAPPGKSFTWRLLSTFVTITVILAILLWIRSLMDNPVVREAIDQARDLMK
jgi:hypothetical protein